MKKLPKTIAVRWENPSSGDEHRAIDAQSLHAVSRIHITGHEFAIIGDRGGVCLAQESIAREVRRPPQKGGLIYFVESWPNG